METNQYLEVFIDESKENLQVVNDQLLELEKEPENLSIVNEIFRAAHTLKGMSATMGYDDLADLTHKMENVFDNIRNEVISVNSNMMDVMFDAVQALEEMIVDIESGGDGKKDVQKIVGQLKLIESGNSIELEQTENELQSDNTIVNDSIDLNEFELTVLNQAKSDGHSIFYVKVTLAEDCLLKAARVYMVFEVLEKSGDVIKSVPTVEQLEEENFENSFEVILVTKDSLEDVKNKIFKVSEIVQVDVQPYTFKDNKEIDQQDVKVDLKEEQAKAAKRNQDNNQTKKAVNNKTIRVNIERLDVLMNLFEELVIDRGRLEQISQELDNSELRSTVERISRVSSNLQNIILTMRMVPIDQVFNRFPRMVRQLARDLGKNIDLRIEGAETELDRTVIDEIGDPLVHLIRNALDHGIETPEQRKQQGKNEQGLLLLKAYHSGNHVFVEIKDDGQGINKNKVLQKAINNGLITNEEANTLSDQQISELIMMSGFSTADKISDVSGRGVGLDVVRNTIESIGGSVEIFSEEGKGTTFSIQLPLTLSIISVMLIVLDEEIYAIPLSSIIETAVIKKEDIMKAHNKEVIDFRGHVVPLVNLRQVLNTPQSLENDEYYSIVIVRKGEKLAGLIVDSFIGQQEIVLKGLGNYLTNIFAISGATILGNGKVALIIDTNALIK
ncbi:chemotaxis protein CheW [Bacillaceae bacterium W0354]